MFHLDASFWTFSVFLARSCRLSLAVSVSRRAHGCVDAHGWHGAMDIILAKKGSLAQIQQSQWVNDPESGDFHVRFIQMSENEVPGNPKSSLLYHHISSYHYPHRLVGSIDWTCPNIDHPQTIRTRWGSAQERVRHLVHESTVHQKPWIFAANFSCLDLIWWTSLGTFLSFGWEHPKCRLKGNDFTGTEENQTDQRSLALKNREEIYRGYRDIRQWSIAALTFFNDGFCNIQLPDPNAQ